MVTESLRETIQKYLPDASDIQVERFADQVERLKKLKVFFQDSASDEERQEFKEKLELAQKALKYEKPYRIAVIGKARTGKSTTINAILGRDLVLAGISGKPATGAALEIFFDVADPQNETATVIYRDEDNIRSLVQDFINRYKVYRLDESKLPKIVDISYATALEQLNPSLQLPEDAKRDFEDLRRSLLDIVKQYNNQHGVELRKNFSLSNRQDIRELMDLINENSPINSETSPNRRIGLVKSVTYHIMPGKSIEGITTTLQLPKNVCLVDLPGLDGTPLHDIIISEGIKEADAVIFIQSPNGILTSGDGYLLNRAKKYISFEGNERSGERIFLVLNAKDSIMTDSEEKKNILRKQMGELMELLVKNYSINFSNRGGDRPYFETSAWIAYQVQRKLKGETTEEPVNYEAATLKLGLKDKTDQEILEASQIPKLIQELNKFAREYRIEGQIRDGKLALDNIVESLLNSYKTELDRLKQEQGEIDFQSQEEQKLNEKQRVVEQLVINFRKSQLDQFANWQQQLKQEAERICNGIDEALKQKIPDIWENSFDDKWNLVVAQQISQKSEEFIVSKTQLEVWKQLNFYVPRLAKKLLVIYKSGVESYQLAQKIAHSCGYDVNLDELESMIKHLIEKKMSHTMTEIASRIAVTYITDPEEYDLTRTAKDDNGKLLNQKLYQIIQDIPRQSTPEIFNSFIAEFRNYYEPTLDDCIISLLNLYRYEMLLIENSLLAKIQKIFAQIRNDDNSHLKLEIRKNLTLDPNWQRQYSLEHKITVLKPIKS